MPTIGSRLLHRSSAFSWLLFLTCLALLASGGLVWPVMAEEARAIAAVADFDNFDTAGEAPDRTAEHADRVKAFAGLLRDSLASGGRYKIVPLVCPRSPCSAASMPPADFLQAARAAGARFLVYGGIHKQSTLVQWALLHVVDLEKDQLVLERMFSLRGDSDEAFRRAAMFIVEYVKQIPVD